MVSEWQWHQLGRVQVCTSLQTDNHARGQIPCTHTFNGPFSGATRVSEYWKGNTNQDFILLKQEKIYKKEANSIYHNNKVIMMMIMVGFPGAGQQQRDARRPVFPDAHVIGQVDSV